MSLSSTEFCWFDFLLPNQKTERMNTSLGQLPTLPVEIQLKILRLGPPDLNFLLKWRVNRAFKAEVDSILASVRHIEVYERKERLPKRLDIRVMKGELEERRGPVFKARASRLKRRIDDLLYFVGKYCPNIETIIAPDCAITVPALLSLNRGLTYFYFDSIWDSDSPCASHIDAFGPSIKLRETVENFPELKAFDIYFYFVHDLLVYDGLNYDRCLQGR